MIIHDVEQNSDEWYALRAGIPTASCLTKILTPKGLTYSQQAQDYENQCVAERLTGQCEEMFTGNYCTERGKEYEEQAANVYELLTDIKTRAVGFVTNDDGTFGCSPDRIAEGQTGLELKCPGAKAHVGYLLGGTLPEQYKLQVQGSIYLTGFPFWDFMSFHPDLEPFWIRVYPDLAIHEAIAKGLERFNGNVQEKLAQITGNTDERKTA